MNSYNFDSFPTIINKQDLRGVFRLTVRRSLLKKSGFTNGLAHKVEIN